MKEEDTEQEEEGGGGGGAGGKGGGGGQRGAFQLHCEHILGRFVWLVIGSIQALGFPFTHTNNTDIRIPDVLVVPSHVLMGRRRLETRCERCTRWPYL